LYNHFNNTVLVNSVNMAELSVEVRVVMCTQNEGKLTEVRKYFEARQTAAAGGAPSVRFVVVSPSEAGLPQVEVDEDQPTLEGNAAKKARQHYRLLPPSPATPTGPCPDQRSMTVVVADDTSLAIETLNGEPGIKVRRWKDGITSMTDEAIITHCLARMQSHSNRCRRLPYCCCVRVSCVLCVCVERASRSSI
jgi:inosine/xanthosine triphosphate pyrophosphatase family protein